MLRFDGMRRLFWAALSTILRWVSKGSAQAAKPPLALAEAAKRGSVAAHFNSLPDARRAVWWR